MIPMVIGEKIRRARQQAGFSQAELAAATGIPLNNMCSYEEGTMDPEIQEQVSLSRILGVSFYYLRHNSCEDPSQHIHMQEAMKASINWICSQIMVPLRKRRRSREQCWRSGHGTVGTQL